jgi:hypothetical protein
MRGVFKSKVCAYRKIRAYRKNHAYNIILYLPMLKDRACATTRALEKNWILFLIQKPIYVEQQ